MAQRLDRGILVAFEGIDGAGKTTQAKALTAALTAAGFRATYRKEPTDGPFGQEIRRSAREGRLSPAAELELFLKDRRDHVDQVLRPELAAGGIVVIDRYYPSTVAYQGARGMDPEELLRLNESFAPRPDLLVILDIDPALGLDRVRSRGSEADLFEREDLLAASRAIFAGLRGAHILRLDARRDVETVAAAVRDRLYRGPLHERMRRRDWNDLPGFELPPPAHIAREIDRLVADTSLSDSERIARVQEAQALAERELAASSPEITD
jgi:dTMP kinase